MRRFLLVREAGGLWPRRLTGNLYPVREQGETSWRCELSAPAARQYLLAGLLACARCGRRLESAWSNGRPVYRCRHGYTSAAGTDPGRPGNTYVREDQILPHLAAIAILLVGDGHARRNGTAQAIAPAQTADLIDQLRASGAVLTYDPQTRTIRAGGSDPGYSATCSLSGPPPGLRIAGAAGAGHLLLRR